MTYPVRDHHLIEDESDIDISDGEGDYDDDGYDSFSSSSSEGEEIIRNMNLTPEELQRYHQWLCDIDYAIYCFFQNE